MPQLKALVWAAVSTLEQADADKMSLDAQIADAQAVAAKHDWHIIDTIRIEGHSRNYRTLAELATAARAKQELGFDRLIDHLDKRDFDVLICRDANRFARKASLLYEIVDIVLEDCKARIYSLADGFVTTENADMWLMVKGYEIRRQMAWIQKEMVRGRNKLVDTKGFPQGSSHVWSHMKLRNELGKVVGFVPDASKRPAIEQAAQLVINRVSWRFIERDLWSSGCGDGGKPFKKYFFYHLFHNPWFWGDACRNHKNQKQYGLPHGQSIGLWCIDASQPVPDGVVMHRAINRPALDGDMAVQLKAELTRRLTFRPKSHRSVHCFSGLLVCGYCGFMMVHSQSDYMCQSKFTARSRPGCDRKRFISEKKLIRWVSAALALMLADGNAYAFVSDAPQPVDHVAMLQTELNTLDKHITRLIEKQMAAPESLSTLYDAQLAGLGTQRDALLKRIDAEQRQAAKYNRADIESAFRELSAYETVDAFWKAEPGRVNQLLHRLLGGRRLVIKDGAVIGSVERP